MRMKKRGLLAVLSFLVVVGIYNVCVFMLVNEYTNLFWISYIFTWIAFLSCIVVLFLSGWNLDTKRDGFLGLPMSICCGSYVLLQLIAGSICMFLEVSFKGAFLIQIILFAFFLLVSFGTAAGQERILETEMSVQENTDFIRNLTMNAENLYYAEMDMGKKNELKKLYEAIRYSDPVSSTSEICLMDEQINEVYCLVHENVEKESTEALQKNVKKILDLLKKRNTLCKLSKR